MSSFWTSVGMGISVLPLEDAETVRLDLEPVAGRNHRRRVGRLHDRRPADAVTGLEPLEVVHRRVDPAVEPRLPGARRPRLVVSHAQYWQLQLLAGNGDPEHEGV